jgi:hypothetical protein
MDRITLSLCKKECTFRITADYKVMKNILAYIKQQGMFQYTPLKVWWSLYNTISALDYNQE